MAESIEIKISPMTRIEGHLDVEVRIEEVTINGETVQQVTHAECSGTMFRGFEIILAGRDPRDAPQYTQRVCGVCPISHSQASCLALENAFGVVPTANGRILRNLVLGANFLQSHILHFYHLAAPDYIDLTAGGLEGGVDMSPWQPQYTSDDLITGEAAATLVGHYVEALAARRKAHQMGAIFGGKLPVAATLVPGGSTQFLPGEEPEVTDFAINHFRDLLTEIYTFINTVYIPDVLAVKGLFPACATYGQGCGNLLAYGVFDVDGEGTKLLKRGRLTGGTAGDVDAAQITEDVTSSWYTGTVPLRPSEGETNPDPTKEEAYSFLKSPRYGGAVYEVGPLARMTVSGEYTGGTSVIDRVAARALEAALVANAMDGWLDDLAPGAPVYQHKATPASATGVGLTEAPRGALGHWVGIEDGKIAHYQIISPTTWNASPKDTAGQFGPIEQALIGTPVANTEQPIELLRVVHSFDPCLACSVHVVRPRKSARKRVV